MVDKVKEVYKDKYMVNTKGNVQKWFDTVKAAMDYCDASIYATDNVIYERSRICRSASECGEEWDEWENALQAEYILENDTWYYLDWKGDKCGIVDWA